MTALALLAQRDFMRSDEGVEIQHKPAPTSMRRKDFHGLVTQKKTQKTKNEKTASTLRRAA